MPSLLGNVNNYTVKKDIPGILARESLVCDSPAGDGKIFNLFYSV